MQIPRLLTRPQFLGAATMGGLSCFQILFNNPANSNGIAHQKEPPLASVYHEPPPDVDYATNPSVFGPILAGQKPSRTYSETADLLAFRDRSPKAPLHALVIPKRYIPDVYSLQPSDPNDIALLQDMRNMGLELVKEQYPQAYVDEDYIFCFHIPPFNSVDHLHLHILAPASEMNMIYAVGARWCTSDVEVMDRLNAGMAAVPYKKLQLF
mmetsp:Transcript_21330/g.45064  ORF Transcript_21330/g.45064 Transcript_21330/m.45064 type:complete len:210 (-) Transcript_21330:1652-2281(-)